MRVAMLAVPAAGVLAVPLLTAAALRVGPPVVAPSFTAAATLSGVAATSPGNAWAVGQTVAAKTLLLHWNGRSWKRVPSPRPVRGGLTAVTATTARNAWAVGGTTRTLILHWNGSRWRQVPSPGPAEAGLSAVTATSARNAWAVGGSGFDGGGVKTLILHWNGTRWRQVSSPIPVPTGGDLLGVTATSATNAWAVGYTGLGGPGSTTLILHWNGSRWKRVRSPDPSPAGDSLAGVAAVSARSVWAVGTAFTGNGGGSALVVHWDGTSWKRIRTRTGSQSGLSGVTVISARNAWAVGGTGSFPHTAPLILHWNGTAWRHVRTPRTAPGSTLLAVTATTRNGWAVGFNQVTGNTLILRWNGTMWK